ncbi:tyrosine-type recombinase/integrase [Variovorax sp. N23]|uniref:tyrosine-type recombinase/integrase n=1 Tax=Variovorax sp. N23 TaxID=2980555 RepID=UPI0021C7D789|nr:integrase arm-type DNA-binding domain-containing protein [Variovorax sp. N23]MCU4122210.1 integrase arm-type DNA-binding domain-containing protein [Variovorax sp. N23]
MALTDTFVRQVKATEKAIGDKYADGGGMYLLVKAAGKYWRMDYSYAGKRKTLALGTYPEVSLAKARDRRAVARELLADGTDPSAAKRAEKQARANSAASTFEVVAREWLSKTAAKRKAITQAKVKTWLEKDVFPFIGSLPISAIGPRDILERVVRKLEARGAIDTAHRIKQLCGQVFRFAVVSGLVERDVTSDLREALAVKAGKHFAAITEPTPAGGLMRSIHVYSGHPCTVAALKLSPLVFVRPGELRTAEWAEFDLDGAEWRIPGSKMKMKVDHIVPLSAQAVEILRALHPISGHGRYVFPSIRTGERPMSENTINAALRGMGYSTEVHTAHGFRAMARTIMDEVLGERVDFIEHQLSHMVKDANGRAYNRTAHLPARREMMQRWADYLDKLRIGAKVIPISRAA